MRLFWIIIGLFSLIAIALAAVQFNPTTTTIDSISRSDAGQPRATESPTRAPMTSSDPQTTSGADQGNGADDERSREGDEESDEALADALAQDLLTSAEQDAGGAAFDMTAPPAGGASDGAPGGPAPSSSGQPHSQTPPKSADNPWMAAAEEGDTAPRLTSSVVEQEDGTKLVDDVFEVRGEGTEADPYVVTWDYLMSAAETYQPRLGMTDIPERIQMLDDKHVRIAGYLLFPTASMEAEECLVMLNMWDGCCIGVMPTPYDAVEVRLAEPVPAGARRYMNYGTIEGTLEIDPYLINDWLIGLYLMEGAELKVGM